MPDTTPTSIVFLDAEDAAGRLRQILGRLRLARRGSPEIDAEIRAALAATWQSRPTEPNALSWSTNLGAALALLPYDHNFCVGRRDGVCWAWIQPNDAWEPAEHESRHDHPAGSGLMVAYTSALAFTSAAISLLARQLTTGENDHRESNAQRLEAASS